MRYIKKIILVLLIGIIAGLTFTSNTLSAAEVPTTQIKIHYFRYGADYTDWNFWLWQYEPTNGAGAAFNLDTNEDGSFVTDDWGAVATVSLSGALEGTTTLGIIARKGDWASKDVAADRFVSIPETSEDGICHIYLVEADERIGVGLDDPNGPDRTDKIRTAYFKNNKTVSYTLTTKLAADKLRVLVDGVATTNVKINASGTSGTITFNDALDFSHSYVLEATFNSGVKSYAITFDGIYDSEAFEEAFAYDGDDLGAVTSDNSTSFKLWAPISSKVVLNLYETGTPANMGGSDTKIKSVDMTKAEKGIWSATLDGNLHGTYYTYSVTNGTNTFEVVDPYAKSAGVNGKRGMVVDFSQVNPEGFEYNSRADVIDNPTDAIIYEVHVRDLTAHSSWGGPSEYSGTFMGLTVNGTTYTGNGVTVSTGLDHIKELGVTHVQLLPIYDHGVIDESLEVPNYNWGYMPLNYNVPEGSYSTNAFDGSVRITELKKATTALNNNGIGVIMDVVYNHTGPSADSNLNLIVPGYYYRMTSDGNFHNGSGCGNETASERYMMSKFIVDSVKFWATEYNLSGFRFDLMALHDIDTMNNVYNELVQIFPDILVYGEPWTGGTSPLNSNIAADKTNLEDMPNVGAFNDEIRDGIKGSVFSASEGGFIQGSNKHDTINKIKYGVVGGINHPQVDNSVLSYQRAWHTSPVQTINYVSAHDNNTLWDKIMLSTTNKQKDLRVEMQKQANAMVLTSQGIPFIHAGAEMLRSKPAVDGGYDENSHESPIETNQIRWDYKVRDNNLDTFNYYKGMIALRKAHPAFRMTEEQDILNNVRFIYENQQGVVAYTISNYANDDTWGTILVVHCNASNQLLQLTLPQTEGTWNLVANSRKVELKGFKEYESGAKFNIFANETLIFYSGERVVEEKGSCSNSKAAQQIISIATTSFAVIAIVRKRKEWFLA